MESSSVKVESPNVKYTNDYIEALYNYTTTKVRKDGNTLIAQPVSKKKIDKFFVYLYCSEKLTSNWHKV